MPNNHSTYRRPFFWPIFLIGFGIVLLLSNLNIIDSVNFYFLLQLWPVLLIAFGLQILFGKSNPWVGNFLAVVVVATSIAFLVFAPSLGFDIPAMSNLELETTFYEEALGGANEASIYLETGSGDLDVIGLPSGNNLIEAEVTTNGDVYFDVSSSSGRKEVSLEIDEGNGINFNFGNFFDSERISTTVELSTKVPLSLEIDQSSGSSTLDLAGIELTDLETANGSGSLTIPLPAGNYPANLDTGSGSLRIDTEDGIIFNLEADVGSGRIVLDLSEEVSGYLDLSSGSGSITITVPESVGVRISGSTGSGNISVPSSYINIFGSDSSGPSENGTWESENFDRAEYQIELDVSVGSGNLRIEFE